MQRRVILLVEDNPDDAELTIRALTRSRILNPVVVARDGMEALDYLFARGAYRGRDRLNLPALILLDLKLPRVNGLAVLAQIRKNKATRLLPVVILTSSKDEQDMMHSYLLGCNGYVRKPVDFPHLSETVTRVGLFWLLVNEPPPGALARHPGRGKNGRGGKAASGQKQE